MDSSMLKGLTDKAYERRKAVAAELEKVVIASDLPKSAAILEQLLALASPTSASVNARNGGLTGLACFTVALGMAVVPFLKQIIPAVLVDFQDTDVRVRYHACESLYNIAKVTRGEMLPFFNEVFDAITRLHADVDTPVKEGASLVDRLMKDIVSEVASTYVSMAPADPSASAYALNVSTATVTPATDAAALNRPKSVLSSNGLEVASRDGVESGIAGVPSGPNRTVNSGDAADGLDGTVPDIDDPRQRAFSLERFIPLLSERIETLNSESRSLLVSWIQVLNSVPELEMVTWLPEYLGGLLEYLADSEEAVRLQSENVLASLLLEIRSIVKMQKDEARRRSEKQPSFRNKTRAERSSNLAVEDEASGADTESDLRRGGDSSEISDNETDVAEEARSGLWEPGQGVRVDYMAILHIMIAHINHDSEMVNLTALQWIQALLDIVEDVVILETARILPGVFPKLSSHSHHIKEAAGLLNATLYRDIERMPFPAPPPKPLPTAPSTSSTAVQNAVAPASSMANSPPNATAPPPPSTAKRDTQTTEAAENTVVRSATDPLEAIPGDAPMTARPAPLQVGSSALRARPSTTHTLSEPVTPVLSEFPSAIREAKSQSSTPLNADGGNLMPEEDLPMPLDVSEIIDILTLQFGEEAPEPRIAALEWLLMLHHKAPQKVLSPESGTFPALLTTLSDPSEDVVKHDLELLAQISVSSDDAYFINFMSSILRLFSSDRKLLEAKGGLIFRQLCLQLNAERIFRTFAFILEKEEDLEFASTIVTKLNGILITAPELADFRRRLRNPQSNDGQSQSLFITLYKTWCHNAVAVFSLCLLAQAYEHASNLLQVFAELELTVALLVQIDKLVMLLESPVFTSLRLQLLEPDKYPHLAKCLYSLLMILPQSSAFVSLKNRLSVMPPSGVIPPSSKPTASVAAPTASSVRAKFTGKDDIKWPELLSHFRAIQKAHEKARLQGTVDGTALANMNLSSPGQGYASPLGTGRFDTQRKKKSVSSRGSMDGGGSSRLLSMSALASRKGHTRESGSGRGFMAANVSLGGAIGSMNGVQGMRNLSPPPTGEARSGALGRKVVSSMRRGGT